MDQAPVRLSEKAHRTADQPISYFMQQAVENPNLISLAAGLVDPLSLPASEVSEALGAIMANSVKARAALQYGTTHGYVALRDKLLARTTALDGQAPADISASINDVVITTGSQQLLYLLSEMLLDPGDLVITEAPSYFVYQGTLISQGVRTLTVPMDDDGMVTDRLEELLTMLERSGEIEKLRLIYVCDYFQNPSGRTLSRARRQHVLELVRRFSKRQRILVIEDAAYRELRYEGPDLPSIKSFDRDNSHVILAHTFSKPLAPGVKTGYGILPTELVGLFLRLKGNHDFGSSNLNQHLLDQLLGSGAYDRHVQELCRVYRHKRDTLLDALHEEFRALPEVQWTHPRGGLYVWLTFPPEIETGPNSPLMRAALREGVLYVPGQFCYIGGGNGPGPACEARLSFGVVAEEKIGEAVHRLAKATASALPTKHFRTFAEGPAARVSGSAQAVQS
jgi:2-aminoadipate transaminase